MTSRKRVVVSLLLASGLYASLPASAVEYRFYHPDPLGSSVVVTDRSGKVIQRTVTTPYGEVTARVDATGQSLEPSANAPRHLFTGQEHDAESNLHYYGARHYDPFAGRFLSQDPVLFSGAGRGLPNGYAYVDNRPTTMVDPDGRFPLARRPLTRSWPEHSEPTQDEIFKEFHERMKDDPVGEFGFVLGATGGLNRVGGAVAKAGSNVLQKLWKRWSKPKANATPKIVDDIADIAPFELDFKQLTPLEGDVLNVHAALTPKRHISRVANPKFAKSAIEDVAKATSIMKSKSFELVIPRPSPVARAQFEAAIQVNQAGENIITVRTLGGVTNFLTEISEREIFITGPAIPLRPK